MRRLTNENYSAGFNVCCRNGFVGLRRDFAWRAAVDVSLDNCGANLCTVYVIQVPAHVPVNLPLPDKFVKHLTRGGEAPVAR